MSKKMLIDSRHPEETRVAILANGKVEDFDFESASRRALRGNIYLARVTRVEPSLQAAFVEYGGNRHGFLAFGEIHPDYYQIPVADRDVLRAADALEAELAAKLAELDSDGLIGSPNDDDDEPEAPAAKASDETDERGDGDDEAKPAKGRRRSRRRRRGRGDKVEASNDDGETAETKPDSDESTPSENATIDQAPEGATDIDSSVADDTPAVETPPNDASIEAASDSVDSDLDAVDADDTPPKTIGLEDPEPEIAQELDDAPTLDDDGAAVAGTKAEAVTDTPAEAVEDTEATTEDDSGQEETTAEDVAAGDIENKTDAEPEDVPEVAEKTAEEREAEETARARKAEIADLKARYDTARREREKLLRNYRIQEVIKRRQIMLVQVVKEERGNKGAALTSYLSLAGRYGVLMPNNARGGGVSRKITNSTDRKRLRKAIAELDVPKGQGLIIRTAGAKRTKAEVKRDYDYLSRLWETIRDQTLTSIAPCMIYEEASLIKRAIRDLYDKDISEIVVEGDDGYREAKDFMKMLMPSHAKHVQPYKERLPLFLRHDVERQLDEMYQPVVNLKSGGYLVIQQTEALISVDVNSGKATKERSVEATALKTNSEAAVEVARQCRLRDLAGLVVIDFIDMDENRNNRAVEKKLKDALKADRARIQVGNISGFGLLEMSRQRRRSGIVDGTTRVCPTCDGAGAVRSVEMAALRILRAVEEVAAKDRPGTVTVETSHDVALYMLNHKRNWLTELEATHGAAVEILSSTSKAGDQFDISRRGKAAQTDDGANDAPVAPTSIDPDDAQASEPSSAGDPTADSDENRDEDAPKRKRRRRRRGKASEGDVDTGSAEATSDQTLDSGDPPSSEADQSKDAASDDVDEDGAPKKRRRRGKRGGRSRKSGDSTETTETAEASETSDANEAPAPAEASPEDSPPTNAPVDAEIVAEPSPAEPAPEPVAPKADTPAPEVKAEPVVSTPNIFEPKPKKAGPKRAGWWSRALGKS